MSKEGPAREVRTAPKLNVLPERDDRSGVFRLGRVKADHHAVRTMRHKIAAVLVAIPIDGLDEADLEALDGQVLLVVAKSAADRDAT